MSPSQIVIPFGATAQSFNISINWGDGTPSTTFVSALWDSISETYILAGVYANSGTYVISISGAGAGPVFLPRIGWNIDNPNAGWPYIPNIRLLTVNSFGDLGITSLRGFLYRIATTVTLPTALPSTVTDLSGFASGATSFNTALNSWDVSNVTNMERMFYGAKNFNKPLDLWNVGAVTNMSSMFSGANAFNQPLSTWNTKSVTNMASMFASVTTFNQDLSMWNVSAVTDMSSMFYQATAFVQNLASWCVPLIAAEPFQFAVGTGIPAGGKPNWGCLLPPAVQPPVQAPVQPPVNVPTASPSVASFCTRIDSNGVCIIEGNLTVSGTGPAVVVIDRPTRVIGSIILPPTATLSIKTSAVTLNATGCVSVAGALTVVANAPAQSAAGQAVPVLQFAGGYCDNQHVQFDSTVLTLVDAPACAQQSGVRAQYTQYSISLLFDYSTSQCDQANSSLPAALSTGAIVGIVIAMVAVLGIAIASVVILRFKYAVRPFDQRNDPAEVKHQEI